MEWNGMEWNGIKNIVFYFLLRMCVCVRIIPEQGGGLLQRCTCSV
jgi:hypothetical protein